MGIVLGMGVVVGNQLDAKKREGRRSVGLGMRRRGTRGSEGSGVQCQAFVNPPVSESKHRKFKSNLGVNGVLLSYGHQNSDPLQNTSQELLK